jgi:hypothetical protein
MSTHQYAAPASARSSDTDVAAWALVAVIVALICALAGWAIASNDVLGQDEVARSATLAARDGLMRGQSVGFTQGSNQGRRETTLTTRTRINAERQQAAREGYEAGYQTGRAKAGDPDAFLGSTTSTGAFPSAGYEDVLAAGLFGADAPGFSSSAYDAQGFGSGATMPYLGAGSTLATSPGDDY